MHSRWVFHRDAGEGRVGHIERPLIEGANAGQPPADLFHGALDVFVRRAHPITDTKRPIHVHHQATKKVGEQILGGESDRQPADAAERQHTGDAEPQGLQHHKRRGDQHRNPHQAPDGSCSGGVERVTADVGWIRNVLLRLTHKTHHEPGKQKNHADFARGHQHLQPWCLALAQGELSRTGQSHQPNQHPNRSADGLEKRIVPQGVGLLQPPFKPIEQAGRQVGDRGRRQDDHKDPENPAVVWGNCRQGRLP